MLNGALLPFEREGRRVHEDPVVAISGSSDPSGSIAAEEAMPARVELVDFEVALPPVEVRVRQVDARRLLRSSYCSRHAHGAGVREEVQHAFALAALGSVRTHGSVIEEQPRVDPILEIHDEAEVSFPDDDLRVFSSDSRVLISLVVLASDFDDEVLGFDA